MLFCQPLFDVLRGTWRTVSPTRALLTPRQDGWLAITWQDHSACNLVSFMLPSFHRAQGRSATDERISRQTDKECRQGFVCCLSGRRITDGQTDRRKRNRHDGVERRGELSSLELLASTRKTNKKTNKTNDERQSVRCRRFSFCRIVSASLWEYALSSTI